MSLEKHMCQEYMAGAGLIKGLHKTMLLIMMILMMMIEIRPGHHQTKACASSASIVNQSMSGAGESCTIFADIRVHAEVKAAYPSLILQDTQPDPQQSKPKLDSSPDETTPPDPDPDEAERLASGPAQVLADTAEPAPVSQSPADGPQQPGGFLNCPCSHTSGDKSFGLPACHTCVSCCSSTWSHSLAVEFMTSRCGEVSGSQVHQILQHVHTHSSRQTSFNCPEKLYLHQQFLTCRSQIDDIVCFGADKGQAWIGSGFACCRDKREQWDHKRTYLHSEYVHAGESMKHAPTSMRLAGWCIFAKVVWVPISTLATIHVHAHHCSSHLKPDAHSSCIWLNNSQWQGATGVGALCITYQVLFRRGHQHLYLLYDAIMFSNSFSAGPSLEAMNLLPISSFIVQCR